MKIHNVEQGTPEWLKLRLGIPTASEFDKIVTPAKGELSKSAVKYRNYLIAERLIGEPLDSVDNLMWVERGKLLEPQAVAQYQFTMDVETVPIGFITTDDGRIGASPDRLLVGQNGGLEIKCPAPQTHVGYSLDGPGADYRCQVQGQLWVAELDFVDFYSFNPAMPPVLIRTERDEPFIAKLAEAVTRFCDELDEAMERIRASGFVATRQSVRSVVEAEYADRLADDGDGWPGPDVGGGNGL